MKRLDLDDLPPKVAALLEGLENGEALLLVQHGAVVGRLTAADSAAAPTGPAVSPEQNVREVFENFRASIEDEF